MLSQKIKKIVFGHTPPRIEEINLRIDKTKYLHNFIHLDKISPEHYDFIIPLKLEDYNHIKNWSPTNQQKALFPNEQVVQIANDKVLFNKHLIELGYGINIPNTEDKSLSFPYIYKKRIDIAGMNSKIIFSAEDENNFESSINKDEYYKQEYITGKEEHTIHILAKNGKIKYFFNVLFKYDSPHYIKGSKTQEKEIVTSRKNSYIKLFKRIIADLDYNGVCCINYKVYNNTVKIFEMNPRFGHTLILDINKFLQKYNAIKKG